MWTQFVNPTAISPVMLFTAFPTPSLSSVSFSLYHTTTNSDLLHTCFTVLIYRRLFKSSQSVDPCLHVLCVFSNWCRLWAFPPFRPRDFSISFAIPHHQQHWHAADLFDSFNFGCLRASPPASLFCVSSLKRDAVCEFILPTDLETSVSFSPYHTTI